MAAPFAQTLHRFEAHLQMHGRSETTIYEYRRRLTSFWCEYLFPRGLELEDVTEELVGAIWMELPRSGSKRRDLAIVLRSFFGWADGRIMGAGANPARELKTPRGQAKKVPRLPEPTWRAITRAAFHREPRRGWTMLLGQSTGARSGSLCGVLVEDVDLARGEIHFRVAKNDRPYSVKLGRKGRIAAHHLLMLAHERGDERLVGVGARQLRYWFRAAADAAHTERVWPHRMRHRFGSKIAEAVGKSGSSITLETWRRSMNHADLSQWPIYVDEDDTGLAEAAEAV